MNGSTFETETAERVGIRGAALVNDALVRVIRTGTHEQVIVMTLPPDGETGDQVHAEADQLFVVVDGVAEARVGGSVLGLEAGDLVFVRAGSRYDLVNRAVGPLRLIAVAAPPAYPAGTVIAASAAIAGRPADSPPPLTWSRDSAVSDDAPSSGGVGTSGRIATRDRDDRKERQAMHKFLISVFDDQVAAFEGVKALKALHGAGDITLFASTVVAREGDGSTKVLQSNDSGPLGTLVGLLGGSLIGGIAGGPVGAVAGAYVGGFGGAMFDLANLGLSGDFVNDVANEFTPGKVVVVADIEESWMTPVDTSLGALGATVYRRYPGEVVDEELDRESREAAKELEQLRAQLKESSGEAKAKLEAAIETQRAKVDGLVKRIDAALEHQHAELEARLATLRAQRAQVADRQKARIDERTEELKSSFAKRRAKLEEARSLAKRSAELTREALAR